MEYSFLPQIPLPYDEVVIFAALLLAGLVGGRLALASGFLPSLTGFIAVGYLVGPQALNWLNADQIQEIRPITDIGIALVLFQLGRRLDVTWLRHDRWLLATALLECALAFTAVYYVLRAFDVAPLESALAGAIAMSTSPATLLLIAQELNAEGQVTNRAMALAAIDNVIALTVFTGLLSAVHWDFGATPSTVALHSLYLLSGSFIAALVGFQLIRLLARALEKQETAHTLLSIGVILLTVGSARVLGLSVALTALLLGVFTKNLDKRHELMHIEFSTVTQVFAAVLFVVVGARLRLDTWLTVGAAALAFVLARWFGKTLAVVALAQLSGLKWAQAGHLSIALLPLAAIALDLVYTLQTMYPAFGADFADIMLAAIALSALLAPVATRHVLIASGDARPHASKPGA